MKHTDILLVTAPFIQYNTPYPATTVLKGFLKTQGYTAEQFDLGIETIDALFSPDGLKRIYEQIRKNYTSPPIEYQNVINNENKYLETINLAKEFLQGKKTELAKNITKGLLPEGPSFECLKDQKEIFQQLDVQDKAKYLATLYFTDLGNLVTDCIDTYFNFCRYAEQFHDDKATFAEIEASLVSNTIVTDTMWQQLSQKITNTNPRVIGIAIPFPGNLYSALKMGGLIKKQFPDCKVVLGGGFVSCELRSLKEPNVFNYTDFVCLDDGERPLLQILEHIVNNKPIEQFVRTFIRVDNEVKYINAPLPDFKHSETGIPDFTGLPLDKYMSVFSVANPMHRLWNDGLWNKMVLAHGCYWHRCSFCDISLDYIKRYSQADVSILCDRIEAIMVQTGQSGFHFVDEAAPPILLRNLAFELLRRNIKIKWWTNIRFDKLFTQDLCRLLAHSGCIAVSGGLEVASDRLLEKMQKGISLEQVTQITSNFKSSGIMVHAYLMYGFPTQTEQETIDSLEVVRQLFSHGLINSGFWHLFVMTIHSETGQHPENFEVKKIDPNPESFPQNDCEHIDELGADHEKFGDGLRKSLYNYMLGNCLENDLQDWFDFKIPETSISTNLVEKYLQSSSFEFNSNSKIVWIGSQPNIENGKKGKMTLRFSNNSESLTIDAKNELEANWIKSFLEKSGTKNKEFLSFAEWETDSQQNVNQPFELFVTSGSWNKLRKNGLLLV